MPGPWDAVTQIGTGISLAAFLATIGAWVYRRALSQRERLIRTAPPDTRPALVADALEFFRVDTRGLTKEQQFHIALSQIEAREKRFVTIVKMIGLIASLSAAVAIFGILRDRSVKTDGEAALRHTIEFTPESPIYLTPSGATVTAIVADFSGKRTNLPVHWRLKYPEEDGRFITLSQRRNTATIKLRDAALPHLGQFELIAEYFGKEDTVSGGVYVLQPQSIRFQPSAWSGVLAALACPRPVVYIIDSRERSLVYNRTRYLANGTNANDVDAILRDLPIVRRIEVITRDWSREADVTTDGPDLIVIHASAFEQVTDPHDSNRRFETFVQYVTARNNKVQFLVYSRGASIIERIPGTSHTFFARNLAQRLRNPTLDTRIHTFHVTPLQGVYWDASTAIRLHGEVESILHLTPTAVPSTPTAQGESFRCPAFSDNSASKATVGASRFAWISPLKSPVPTPLESWKGCTCSS